MLLFFSFIIVVIVSAAVISSELRINIKQLEIESRENKLKSKYNIAIEFLIFGKIKIISIKLQNGKKFIPILNKHIKEKFNQMRNSRKITIKSNMKTIQKLLKLAKEKIIIKRFKLLASIDTQDVIVTSYLVGIISTIIPNVLKNHIKKYNQKEYNWEIIPKYKNKDYIYIKLSSITTIKVVHIINMLKILGGKKNERSSNRRFNVNCYGKY